MKNKFIILGVLLLTSCESITTSISLIPSITIPSSITTSTSISTTISNTTSENITNTLNTITPPLLNDKKKIKIYLNPSVQKGNLYYNKVNTEAEMMNKVSNEIYTRLSNDSRFIVYHNNRYLNLKDSIQESNSLNVDYHIALHTNAGGGSGSEAYYGTNSYFANHILNSFNKYHTFKNRGVKNGNHLYEIKNSTAKNKALIEFLFHDNKQESEFIIKNYVVLALSICEALYDLVKE